MQVEAKTNSACMKRGADKKIAKQMGVSCDVRDLCGSLRLDAMNPADLAFLTKLYQHVFSFPEKRGSVVVKDKDGSVVIEYGFALAAQGEQHDH